jgi:crossover junction endodeoxyribonuclease RusA
MSLLFTVYGEAAPQGSHKGYVVKGHAVITESNESLAPWRAQVTAAARAAMPEGWSPLAGAVSVTLIFHLRRPLAAPKTKDIHAIKKPDIEKLVRGIHDALTDAGVWLDDSQVVSLRADKQYAVPPALTRIYDPEIHADTPCVTVLVQEAD